jgi:hypothetical protein
MQVMRGNEGWHTDSSYMPLSAKASVLSAHVVPPAGGETEWADMRAAFEALDDATRERIAKLSAYHSIRYSQARIGDTGPGIGYGKGQIAQLEPAAEVGQGQGQGQDLDAHGLALRRGPDLGESEGFGCIGGKAALQRLGQVLAQDIGIERPRRRCRGGGKAQDQENGD